MMWSYYRYPFWFGPGDILSVILWILVAVAIAMVVRAVLRGWGAAPDRGDDRATEILKERYARGEIDKKEFEDRMDTLTRRANG